MKPPRIGPGTASFPFNKHCIMKGTRRPPPLLASGYLDLGLYLYRNAERQLHETDRRAGVVPGRRAVEIQDQVGEPVDAFGCRTKPGAELTIPKTLSHATTRSRSPSIESAVSRAAS